MSNQADSRSPLEASFTDASDIEIVDQAVAMALSTLRRWQRDRRFQKWPGNGDWVGGQRGLRLAFTVRLHYQAKKTDGAPTC